MLDALMLCCCFFLFSLTLYILVEVGVKLEKINRHRHEL